jgi:hypothetical protein
MKQKIMKRIEIEKKTGGTMPRLKTTYLHELDSNADSTI